MQIRKKKINVLIIDDSAVVRQLLKEILSADDEIFVVGTATDPYVARDKIKRLNPDVITLDVEMPKMDGISFLRNLMRLRPMPVIMISSLTEAGANTALEALALGAIDYVSKPKDDLSEHLVEYSKEIISKVKSAVSSRIITEVNSASARGDNILDDSTGRKYSNNSLRDNKGDQELIALGASTGGTEAIKEILINMHPDSPGVVISQHIPRAFSGAFAARMDKMSALSVCQAEHGQLIKRGHVYIAPGDLHLTVKKDAGDLYCVLDDSDPVNRHKPSVDVMFNSVARTMGAHSIGVLLTGMGADGSRGLGEMQDAGATTIVQDEETSVVWGMPGSAVKLGVVDYILPVSQIANKISLLLKT